MGEEICLGGRNDQDACEPGNTQSREQALGGQPNAHHGECSEGQLKRGYYPRSFSYTVPHHCDA